MEELGQSSFVQPKVKADKPVSERATDNKYAELSINQSVNEAEPKSTRSSEEERKVEKPPAAVKRQAAPPQPEKGGGGLFGTIASFFLTESEMENSTNQARQVRRSATEGAGGADEASEYEYYEEYDDEVDADNPDTRQAPGDAYEMVQKGLTNL